MKKTKKKVSQRYQKDLADKGLHSGVPASPAFSALNAVCICQGAPSLSIFLLAGQGNTCVSFLRLLQSDKLEKAHTYSLTIL